MELFTEITGIRFTKLIEEEPHGRIYDFTVNDQEPDVCECDKQVPIATANVVKLDKIHLTISGPRNITEVVWGKPANLEFKGYQRYTASLVDYRLQRVENYDFDPMKHCDIAYKLKVAALEKSFATVSEQLNVLTQENGLLSSKHLGLFQILETFLSEIEPESDKPEERHSMLVEAGILCFVARSRDAMPVKLGKTGLQSGYYAF